jgi:hypothetical protein
MAEKQPPMPDKGTLTQAEMDAQIDELDTQHDENALFVRIHERRRKRGHAAAKASQPALHVRGTALHDGLIETLKAEFRAPITTNEQEPTGMDYLLQTVQDCLDANDFEDSVFAMMRVVRKAYCWNRHLGPINPAAMEKK